jgi:hypothetical protein
MNTLEYQVGPPLPISIEIDNVTTEKKNSAVAFACAEVSGVAFLRRLGTSWGMTKARMSNNFVKEIII